MAKKRLDVLLVERGMVESRNLAQRLVMAGQVRVGGQVELKSSTPVEESAELSIDARPAYVSRGGDKLAGAFEAFPLDVEGAVCADVGASTGGFTDYLLQHGASRVYAIDVGQGILHWKLRQDERVVVMEKTNARHVESLPEAIALVVMDVSFISLSVMLPVVKDWLSPQGQVVALIKPQFEAGKKEAARGKGVIRDPQVHRRVLEETLTEAQSLGFWVSGLIRSPITGPKGNVEFLVWLRQGEPKERDLGKSIREA